MNCPAFTPEERRLYRPMSYWSMSMNPCMACTAIFRDEQRQLGLCTCSDEDWREVIRKRRAMERREEAR